MEQKEVELIIHDQSQTQNREKGEPEVYETQTDIDIEKFNEQSQQGQAGQTSNEIDYDAGSGGCVDVFNRLQQSTRQEEIAKYRYKYMSIQERISFL